MQRWKEYLHRNVVRFAVLEQIVERRFSGNRECGNIREACEGATGGDPRLEIESALRLLSLSYRSGDIRLARCGGPV
jgi:hypothetical protein